MNCHRSLISMRPVVILLVLLIQLYRAIGEGLNPTPNTLFPHQEQKLFGDLLRQYDATPTVHFKARIQIAFNADGVGNFTQKAEKTEGYFEFWYDLGKYRILSQLSKSSETFEVAFNGTNFQFFEGADKSLSLSTNSTDGFGATPPIPLLAPFEFLKPPDGGSDAHQVLWNDVKRDSPLLARLDAYRIRSEQPLVVEFEGGIVEDQPFFYRVHFTTNSIRVPNVIEAIGTNGNVILRSSLFYEPNGTLKGSSTIWPMRLVREGFTKEGLLEMQVVENIETLSFEPLAKEPSSFVIDTNRARRIFNSDTRHFIKIRRDLPVTNVRIVFFTLCIMTVASIYLLFRSRSRMER